MQLHLHFDAALGSLVLVTQVLHSFVTTTQQPQHLSESAWSWRWNILLLTCTTLSQCLWMCCHRVSHPSTSYYLDRGAVKARPKLALGIAARLLMHA